MSIYSSVEIDGFDDGPGASPWCDVAHDNGIGGGQVRVTLGETFDKIGRTVLTPEHARSLAAALVQAAERAEEGWLS